MKLDCRPGSSFLEGTEQCYNLSIMGLGNEFIINQLLQIFGAMLILAAYVLAQLRVLDLHSYIYLFLNVAGAAILGYLAFVGDQWGFLLLEGAWALVSIWGIVVRLRSS